MDEQEQSVVKKELASESLSARTELDFVCPESIWSEGQRHKESVAPDRWWSWMRFSSLPGSILIHQTHTITRSNVHNKNALTLNVARSKPCQPGAAIV